MAEVVVSSTEDECFEIESATSQKGIVKLVSRKELENGYKLELKIVPPPSKHHLGVFSDTLYMTLKPDASI